MYSLMFVFKVLIVMIWSCGVCSLVDGKSIFIFFQQQLKNHENMFCYSLDLANTFFTAQVKSRMKFVVVS